MVMQCQVSEMTWEIDRNSTLERLSVLTDMCTEYLVGPYASSNTIQSMISHSFLERKIMEISNAKEMVLWREWGEMSVLVFMRLLGFSIYTEILVVKH